VTEQPTWLILIRSEPYSSTRAEAGIDAALACGAFGQAVRVIFEGDGLGVLRAAQVAPVGHRDLFKQVTSFPLYDIESIYAVGDEAKVKHYLGEYAPGDLHVRVINLHELGKQIASATHVLSF